MIHHLSKTARFSRPLAAVGCACAMAFSVAAFGAAPAEAQTETATETRNPTIQFENLWLGSAWYPEHWPEERWAEDLRLMKEHGANVVRIGEYAWSKMEPSEGVYDMDWLVRVVRLAAEYDIKVVIGTPTDTPPAWLTQKYPDTMHVNAEGKVTPHGMRRHFSISSPRYREFSRKIVEKMVEALGHEPNVIGWQIGNEPTDESYDPSALKNWHTWLETKYKTLDNLNDAWTTAYWSQTYTAWDQVPFHDHWGNPGWRLDLKRFITDEWVSFHQNQFDVIAAGADPEQFITVNLGGLGWANRFNRYDANRGLDFSSWDTYVGMGHLEPYRIGATHDLVRGWKRMNFWVMETQPGYVNWAQVSNMLYPGETRAVAWQSVGHGSDAVLYWQWRNALNGQESMHGAIIGQDGEPLPIYEEIKQIGEDFKTAAPSLVGTTPVSEVAILHDYDSRWAIEFQKNNKDYEPIDGLLDYYRPLKDALGAVDIVEPIAPLSQYKLVVAPNLNVITEEMAQLLIDYVKGGGNLVLGPRSGMKDFDNKLFEVRQPGPLAELLGARVEQYYALDETIGVEGGEATLWAENLIIDAPGEVDVLLRYTKANGWLDGKIAAVKRSVGEGSISYIGAIVDDGVVDRLMGAAMDSAQVARDFDVPQDVELMIREGEGRSIAILINHGKEARRVKLPREMNDILNGGLVKRVDLAPEGVAVLDQSGGE